jgi:hypothetical protein
MLFTLKSLYLGVVVVFSFNKLHWNRRLHVWNLYFILNNDDEYKFLQYVRWKNERILGRIWNSLKRNSCEIMILFYLLCSKSYVFDINLLLEYVLVFRRLCEHLYNNGSFVIEIYRYECKLQLRLHLLRGFIYHIFQVHERYQTILC